MLMAWFILQHRPKQLTQHKLNKMCVCAHLVIISRLTWGRWDICTCQSGLGQNHAVRAWSSLSISMWSSADLTVTGWCANGPQGSDYLKWVTTTPARLQRGTVLRVWRAWKVNGRGEGAHLDGITLWFEATIELFSSREIWELMNLSWTCLSYYI